MRNSLPTSCLLQLRANKGIKIEDITIRLVFKKVRQNQPRVFELDDSNIISMIIPPILCFPFVILILFMSVIHYCLSVFYSPVCNALI